MKKIILFAFIFFVGLLQAQQKSKSNTKTKKKVEKEWINPVKLTKEEHNRPYMEDVLKTRDSLTPKEAERRRKNIAIGNPFAKQGYYPKIATLSRGKYLEFHDRDSIVVIGSIKYNTKQKKIVDFIVEDLSNPDRQPIGDTHGMWMSPDPLSEEFPDWSPYNYAFSNPINNIDPTGLAPEDWVKKGNSWSFNQNITTAEQAKAEGFDDFAANGSTVDNASINGGKTGAVYLGYNANDVAYSENNFTNWNSVHGGEYGNQLEAYRSWQSNPGYHKGEGFWDRMFRNIGYGTMEARRDFASGGMNMYGGYGRAVKALESAEQVANTGNTVTRTESVLGHIFRDANGHVSPTTLTSQNRYINLFESVSNNPLNLNQSILKPSAIQNGVQGFTQDFRSGQIWVQMRNGKIFDAGVNPIVK